LATGPAIITIDKSHLQQTILQCRRVLMDQFEHKMPIRDFIQQYFQYYAKQCNLEEFRKDLANVVQVCINLLVKYFPIILILQIFSLSKFLKRIHDYLCFYLNA